MDDSSSLYAYTADHITLSSSDESSSKDVKGAAITVLVQDESSPELKKVRSKKSPIYKVSKSAMIQYSYAAMTSEELGLRYYLFISRSYFESNHFIASVKHLMNILPIHQEENIPMMRLKLS
jgi:hypothetical protein